MYGFSHFNAYEIRHTKESECLWFFFVLTYDSDVCYYDGSVYGEQHAIWHKQLRSLTFFACFASIPRIFERFFLSFYLPENNNNITQERNQQQQQNKRDAFNYGTFSSVHFIFAHARTKKRETFNDVCVQCTTFTWQFGFIIQLRSTFGYDKKASTWQQKQRKEVQLTLNVDDLLLQIQSPMFKWFVVNPIDAEFLQNDFMLNDALAQEF